MANWKNRVKVTDLWEDEGLSFEETRDAVVERLEALGIEDEDEFTPFSDIVNGLRYSEDESEFDQWWDELYDWGDEGHRLWIETF